MALHPRLLVGSKFSVLVGEQWSSGYVVSGCRLFRVFFCKPDIDGSEKPSRSMSVSAWLSKVAAGEIQIEAGAKAPSWSQRWQDAAHARGCCVTCNKPHKTKNHRTGKLTRICVHCTNKRTERRRHQMAEAAR